MTKREENRDWNKFELAGESVAPGNRAVIDLQVGSSITNEAVSLKTHIVRGMREGPCLMVIAGLHGDEIAGIEIVRRLLKSPLLKRLRGTLIALPLANPPAFLYRSRYLPDRRDLNRLFPGSASGSLGARIANRICSDLLPHCDAIIDMHSGASGRPNLPQVRVTDKDAAATELAGAFNPPVILRAPIRPSSFREVAYNCGVPTILFESGEALRLDTPTIRFGLQGVISVMRHLGMLPATKRRKKQSSVQCTRSFWERAPHGGLFTPLLPLGRAVAKGTLLGFIADPLGSQEYEVRASDEGILVGRTNEGVADEGDALYHIAVTGDPGNAENSISRSGDSLPVISEDNDDHPVGYDPFSESLTPLG